MNEKKIVTFPVSFATWQNSGHQKCMQSTSKLETLNKGHRGTNKTNNLFLGGCQYCTVPEIITFPVVEMDLSR